MRGTLRRSRSLLTWRELCARAVAGHGGAPCVDDEDSCEDWAGSGECQRNPGFMATSCRLSCKVRRAPHTGRKRKERVPEAVCACVGLELAKLLRSSSNMQPQHVNKDEHVSHQKRAVGEFGDACSKAHFFPVRSRARQEGRHVGSMFDEDRHTNRLTTVPTSPHDAEHAAPHPPLLRESDVAAGVRAAATRHGDGGRRGGGAGVRRSAQRRAHAAAGLRHGGARLRQVVQGGSRRAGGGLPPHRHRTGRRVVGILSLPLPSSSASATHDDAHRRAERAERNACWIDHWRRSTDSVEAEGSMLRPHANSGRSALKVAVV